MEVNKFTEKSNQIVDALEGFVRGKISKKEFEQMFPIILSKYEEIIGDSAYSPLSELVPSSDENVEWLDRLIENYRIEIERLEKEKMNPEKPYATTLSKEKYHELCREGLECFLVEILDRTTKYWVESNLIDEEEFNFFDKSGKSLFGAFESLYKCELKYQSLFLTAFNGGIPSFPRTLEGLLEQLRELGNQEPSVWIRCYDADGFLCVEPCNNFDDPYKNMGAIQWIELTDSQQTQGGICNLLLLPKSKEWMLTLSNNFDLFEIGIHGSERFVERVVNGA